MLPLQFLQCMISVCSGGCFKLNTLKTSFKLKSKHTLALGNVEYGQADSYD